MSFDIERVRALYPALSDGYAWLDAAAGTQVPQPVIDAIAAAYTAGIGNSHGAFPASARSDAIVGQARQAVADLVGGDPRGVVFGPNMTTLTYRFAYALSKEWGPDDEIVLSRLDHDANVRPWVQAATRAGARVRWASVDVPSGELPAEQYDELVTERTRLVAVTAASNILGTMPDIPRITERAHAVGALTYVDGVHATPHLPIDVAALGADFYATSSYKWSGPHIGSVIARPELLERLQPDKLASSPSEVPDRFETGTLPFADLAGVAAAVDHLADLDPDATGTRRERLLASMAAVEAYEQAELAHLLKGLSSLSYVRLVGSPARRTATVYFNVAGHSPQRVAEHLAARRINVWDGHCYAWELTRALGIRDEGSAVRAGLVHYNDRSDVDRLLEALDDLPRHGDVNGG
ncbi:cysteine desulfurase-like protein [Sphaerimonospora thailandensis]|uniref:Cysteine desulfurase-like protein n=1 Tax=Sphaerimonospora thailandensis TaxID=795644 RepID=A0A8J3R8Y4_9ACTN|nr:cysteine desulfurase-like protein [Sphaerimonospora thailandensis]GIH69579.1 cysteine desulfurase-like protein [Sphaerimonospora thailandensis]